MKHLFRLGLGFGFLLAVTGVLWFVFSFPLAAAVLGTILVCYALGAAVFDVVHFEDKPPPPPPDYPA